MFEGRLFLIGGHDMTNGIQTADVREWNVRNGWVSKSEQLSNGSDDANGVYVPYFKKFNFPSNC